MVYLCRHARTRSIIPQSEEPDDERKNRMGMGVRLRGAGDGGVCGDVVSQGRWRAQGRLGLRLVRDGRGLQLDERRRRRRRARRRRCGRPPREGPGNGRQHHGLRRQRHDATPRGVHRAGTLHAPPGDARHARGRRGRLRRRGQLVVGRPRLPGEPGRSSRRGRRRHRARRRDVQPPEGHHLYGHGRHQGGRRHAREPRPGLQPVLCRPEGPDGAPARRHVRQPHDEPPPGRAPRLRFGRPESARQDRQGREALLELGHPRRRDRGIARRLEHGARLHVRRRRRGAGPHPLRHAHGEPDALHGHVLPPRGPRLEPRRGGRGIRLREGGFAYDG